MGLLSILLLCLILAGCSSNPQAVYDDNPVPVEFRSSNVVVPSELADEFAAMPGLWLDYPQGSTNPLSVPLEVRRAHQFWVIDNNQSSGEKDVSPNSIELLTLPGGEQELDAAAQALAADLGLEITQSEYSDDRGYYLFDVGTLAQIGESAWLSDQILLRFPDLVSLAEPEWAWKSGFPKMAQ